ncbi:MAG TPA: hypothetical protein VEC13_01240 [Candidatus Paceibacterota bacterium]|nr:hypothetical protein [Candidatus Paceibacterota bacterium]
MFSAPVVYQLIIVLLVVSTISIILVMKAGKLKRGILVTIQFAIVVLVIMTIWWIQANEKSMEPSRFSKRRGFRYLTKPLERNNIQAAL